MFDTHDGVESAAPEGATVFEGDVMRSGDDGHAVVLFFDGSTLTLEPLTTIRIDAAHSGGTSTIVRIAQIAGTTWHSVHKLLDPGSRYEVTTPGMVAAVRGTAFQVDVGEGNDNVTTEEGAVEVTANSQTVR